jgi:hypothetical protein
MRQNATTPGRAKSYEDLRLPQRHAPDMPLILGVGTMAIGLVSGCSPTNGPFDRGMAPLNV